MVVSYDSRLLKFLGDRSPEGYAAWQSGVDNNFLDDAVLQRVDLNKQPAHLWTQGEIIQLQLGARLRIHV
jgi:hypothetical protein